MRTVAAVCLMAVLATVPALAAKGSGDSVDVYATVVGIREMPAGGALPGLHLDAKIDGRMTDIYVAPMGFLTQFGMTFEKGDDVHVLGSRTKVAGADVVLASEIAVGAANRKTLYLRDEKGPFWTEDTRPGHR